MPRRKLVFLIAGLLVWSSLPASPPDGPPKQQCANPAEEVFGQAEMALEPSSLVNAYRSGRATAECRFRLGAPSDEGKAKSRKETARRRVDFAGDPLPRGARIRLGTVRLRHHDGILCLALSPDGKWAASCGADWAAVPAQPIRLWDLGTGKEVRQFREPSLPAGSITFSPDGKLLASLNAHRSDTICLWDVATGKLLRRIAAHRGDPNNARSARYGLAFSRDGRVLASSGGDATIQLWEVATGKQLQSWEQPEQIVSLVFSPDGTQLAAGGEGDIRLLDVATGKERRTFRGHQEQVYSLHFAANGRQLLSGTEDGTVRWWDCSTGLEIARIRGALLACSPGGRTAALRRDRDIEIWNVPRRKRVARFPARGRFFWFAGLSYFSGGITEDGSLLVAADRNTIRIVNTRTGAPVHTFAGHTGGVLFVGFSADGEELISAGDTALRCWDIASGKETRRFTGHERSLTGAAMTVDRAVLASGSNDGTVRLWDRVTGKERHRLPVPRYTAPLVAFSADGQTLAVQERCGSAKRLAFSLWRVRDGTELHRFGFGYSGQALVFWPGEKELALLGGSLGLLRLPRGSPYRQFKGLRDTGNETALSFSRDGRMSAVSYSDNKAGSSVAVWEVASEAFVRLLRGSGGEICSLTFSPDDRTLAAGYQDGSLRLWDIVSAREFTCFAGHRGCVRALAFSADGRLLASGGADSSVLIWDTRANVANDHLHRAALSKVELRKLWLQLHSEDAGEAHQAVWGLATAGPLAVSLLERELLPPGGGTEERRVSALLDQLDHRQFRVREAATRELILLGQVAENPLRRLLDNKPSPEVRSRAEKILADLQAPGRISQARRLRWARLASVLEKIGTTAAHRLLCRLAREHPAFGMRQEARATLERFRTPASGSP